MSSWSRARDLAGQCFGALSVIERVENKGRYSYWNCLCTCGNYISVRGTNLSNGHSKSCGCKRGMKPHPFGSASAKKLFIRYKQSAARRGIEFTLSLDEFLYITKQLCAYCSAPPSTGGRAGNYNGGYVYNGIDRVNNAEGYTQKNVVPCCWRCNNWKSNLDVNDFLSHIKAIYICKIGDTN